MIEKIHIQNFKSIYDLEIETSRINLFIGENGSGKSN
ncbi:MAG: AAA family ATPase, partial [Campylobacterota bacterium]|nr:AAA family ATPase [Campylobacterota bacterium]